MTTNEKIAALRAAAVAAGADGVLLMTSDPHCSEYLPGYYNALPWFSGFIGENSTLVVTKTGSALWCDGRFYVPLYDNTGKLRVKEGEVLSTEDANAMQWFLPNVIDNWADKPVD